jgi:hypothetical protein
MGPERRPNDADAKEDPMSHRHIIRAATTITLSALGLALAAGCAVSSSPDPTGQNGSAIEGDSCDPGDATCNPCPPDNPNCDPSQINCDPTPVQTTGACDQFWGVAWSGTSCVELTGCECTGACDALYPSIEECAHAHEGCVPVPVDCNVLAEKLASLLAAAKACNVASMSPKAQCGFLVPTIFGCPTPVASQDSAETQAYLGMFEIYAKSCTMAVPACPDPTTLVTGCEQGPDVDSLIGTCAIVDDGSVPPNADQ